MPPEYYTQNERRTDGIFTQVGILKRMYEIWADIVDGAVLITE